MWLCEWIEKILIQLWSGRFVKVYITPNSYFYCLYLFISPHTNSSPSSPLHFLAIHIICCFHYTLLDEVPYTLHIILIPISTLSHFFCTFFWYSILISCTLIFSFVTLIFFFYPSTFMYSPCSDFGLCHYRILIQN